MDEIHNLNLATRSGAESSDQLKYLAERIPATFVYAGIDVEHAGLFAGVRGRQIAGRFASITTTGFAYGTRIHREQWAALVRFVADVWGHFDGDHTRPGTPLFPSERENTDGTCGRVGDDALRAGLAEAAAKHLPGWADTLTPHVLRHYAASRLYQGGLDLVAIQEVLGHSWIATTMRYVHVHRTHVEDAWTAGHERAAQRMKGLLA